MTTTLTAGTWMNASADRATFHAWNPSTGEPIERSFPISNRDDLDAMAAASVDAAAAMATAEPGRIARFLRGMAERIDARRAEIAGVAHEETGLPLEPRLAQVEFDRMLGQLRQAADAAEDVSGSSWRRPLVDSEANIRSDRGSVAPSSASVRTTFPSPSTGSRAATSPRRSPPAIR